MERETDTPVSRNSDAPLGATAEATHRRSGLESKTGM